MFKLGRNLSLKLNSIKSTSVSLPLSTNAQTNKSQTTTTKQQDHVELDDLFKRVIVHVRGHDKSVLDSYKQFVEMTSKELELNLTEVREPHRFIERWTLLKSRFSNRKHLRQYEMRTYFREFEFKHLTGSTCDTLLEFIQRNLPEGVAMHVHKTKISQLPEHFFNQEQQ